VNPPLTSTITGLQNGETSAVVSGLVLNTTADTVSPVGTYTITPSGATAANYVFSFVNGTLSVTSPVTVNAAQAINQLIEDKDGKDDSKPEALSEKRDGVKKCGTVDGLPAGAPGGAGVVCASIIEFEHHASRSEPQKLSQLTRQ